MEIPPYKDDLANWDSTITPSYPDQDSEPEALLWELPYVSVFSIDMYFQ